MTFDATYSVGLLDFQKEAINMIKGGGKNILHTRLVGTTVTIGMICWEINYHI